MMRWPAWGGSAVRILASCSPTGLDPLLDVQPDGWVKVVQFPSDLVDAG